MPSGKRLLVVVLLLQTIAAQAAPIALRNFREIMASLEMVTGVSATDPNVSATYKKVITRLPLKGEVNEFSSPMILALTELTGVMCRQMVQEQKKLSPGLRIYFAGVDFAKSPKQFSAALKEETLRELSQAFWQRDASSEEFALLKTNFDGFLGASTDSSLEIERILFMACVELATSIGFITY